MRITEFLSADAVVDALTARTKPEVIAALAAALARANPSVSEARFLSVLQERERIGSTGMEKGVAIPHGRLPELSNLVACFALSRSGVEFDARDGQRSHFFFALVAPETSPGLHLKALSKLSRLFRSEQLKDALLTAPTARAIYDVLCAEDARS